MHVFVHLKKQSPLLDLWTAIHKGKFSSVGGRHTRAFCDSGSSGAEHLVRVWMWWHVAALDPGRHDVSGSGSLGFTALTTGWTLVNTVQGPQWLQALLWSSVVLPGSAVRAGIGDGLRCWCSHTHLWWPAAGACVEAGPVADAHIVVGSRSSSKG